LSDAAAATDQARALRDQAEQELRLFEQRKKAEELRAENQRLLDLEIEKIKQRAILEGKSVESTEVQKQILDANLTAYENLIQAAREYMGTIDDSTERERFRAEVDSSNFEQLRQRWAENARQAEVKKFEDDQELKRIQAIGQAQQEAQQKLNSILSEATVNRDRLIEEENLQKELAKLRKKYGNDEEKVQLEFAKRRAELVADRQMELLDQQKEMAIAKTEELLGEELAKYEDNEQMKVLITKKYEEEIEKIKKDHGEAAQLIEENLDREIVNINQQKVDAIKKQEEELNRYIIQLAQELLSAANSIANSISTTWHNYIDYQLNEDLRANDKRIQSDEERAAKEKELMTKAAYEKYKVDMYMWSANVTLATANAAMAVLNAMTMQPWQVALAQSIIAGAMGAFQVAAVISAQPQPPRFHSGTAYVNGPNEEVPAILKRGESVLPPGGFGNVMDAFANLANARIGGTEMNVKVYNNASNKVRAEPQMTREGLIVTVTEIVKQQMGNGALDSGFLEHSSRSQGVAMS
jgi:hypothetical protein